MPHSNQKDNEHNPPRNGHEDPDAAQACASPSSYLGLKYAESPRTDVKSVSISNQPEVISPLILGDQKNVEQDLDLGPCDSPRKRVPVRGPSSKRLSGRPAITPSPVLKANRYSTVTDEVTDTDELHPKSRSSHHHLESLIDQVSEWIKEERKKRAGKRVKHPVTDGSVESKDRVAVHDHANHSGNRRDSDASDSSFDLNKLEDIIKYNLSFEHLSRRRRHRSPTSSRKGSLAKLWRKQSSASSDNDHPDNDFVVPSCDAVLDNTKTLQYVGGASSDSGSSSDELQRTASYKDRDAWAKFKFEIVRLTHTLRLKGWRKVQMKSSNHVTVERLSGALTNAVYVVSPPADLPHHTDREGSSHHGRWRKPPPKLLLRIYGPQVGHLIDRDAELAILRRLAKKKIGPRLLGTFANGRFEEFFYANPLTPDDLRNPDTSRQIAKRMRELHDGVELLDEEREAGAFVWRNWDKWVNRVEQVVLWLDCQIKRLEPGVKPTGPDAWKRRGHICLTPWRQFRQMVEKYRKWLEAQYGGREEIRHQLVFAHNDTQYGNILRLMPTGESPLLLPANTHKQLVVIDFEYASANVPGLEFANHFTEWCYNYHDPRKPYAFHAEWYPTPEEQDRFIRAYVRHRPQYNVSTPILTPTRSPSTTSQDDPPSRRPTSSISDFMLDARTPSSSSVNLQNEEAARKAVEDREVAHLAHETRIWRLANTAMWVAWGIVQAKPPGMPDFGDEQDSAEQEPSGDEDGAREDLGDRADVYKELAAQQPQQDGEEVANGSEQDEVDEEFDYLGYAQHRAMFFWADAIQMGFVKEEELPEEVKAKVKRVPY